MLQLITIRGSKIRINYIIKCTSQFELTFRPEELNLRAFGILKFRLDKFHFLCLTLG